jgi:hypothetical protein
VPGEGEVTTVTIPGDETTFTTTLTVPGEGEITTVTIPGDETTFTDTVTITGDAVTTTLTLPGDAVTTTLTVPGEGEVTTVTIPGDETTVEITVPTVEITVPTTVEITVPTTVEITVPTTVEITVPTTVEITVPTTVETTVTVPTTVTATTCATAAPACPTGNVVSNGDFQQSLSGTWTTSATGVDRVMVSSTNYVVQVSSQDSATLSLSQAVAVCGGNYRFTIARRAVTSSGTIRLKASLQSAGTTYTIMDTSLLTSNTLLPTTIAVTIPAGVTQGTLVLDFSFSGGGSSLKRAEIDNVTFGPVA